MFSQMIQLTEETNKPFVTLMCAGCVTLILKSLFLETNMATLAHIARESSDITRLAKFYKEVFGFEEIESPDFGDLKVIWLNLRGAFAMHIIHRNPSTKLPEGPYSATSAVRDPSHLPMGHHVCFSVSDFDSFLASLKEKGIETFHKSLPDGKVKQVFFFDPDGNGLEVASRSES